MRQVRPLALVIVLVVLCAGALLPPVAQAGGWSVVTLDDEPPAPLVIGTPFDIRFTVRQHGVRLVDGLTPMVRLSHQESGDQLSIAAQPTGRAGQYRATLRLAHAGRWEWEIDAFGPPAPLAALDAVAAAPAAQPSAPPFSPWLLHPSIPAWLLLALAAAAAGAGMLPHRRKPTV